MWSLPITLHDTVKQKHCHEGHQHKLRHLFSTYRASPWCPSSRHHRQGNRVFISAYRRNHNTYLPRSTRHCCVPYPNQRPDRATKQDHREYDFYVRERRPQNWDEILPYLIFAYNTRPQETTCFTPFRLVHGREVTTMIDPMLQHGGTEVLTSRAEEFTGCAEAARHLA